MTIQDVIDLLQYIHDWRDPVTDCHPFGTIDYMQIEDAIKLLQSTLSKAVQQPTLPWAQYRYLRREEVI